MRFVEKYGLRNKSPKLSKDAFPKSTIVRDPLRGFDLFSQVKHKDVFAFDIVLLLYTSAPIIVREPLRRF